MNYICCVQIFDSAKQIVDHCLNVLYLKMNCTLYHLLEIALCELKDDVDAVEVLWVFGLNHVNDLNHVGMLELA